MKLSSILVILLPQCWNLAPMGCNRIMSHDMSAEINFNELAGGEFTELPQIDPTKDDWRSMIKSVDYLEKDYAKAKEVKYSRDVAHKRDIVQDKHWIHIQRTIDGLRTCHSEGFLTLEGAQVFSKTNSSSTGISN
ncbi:hypothetical protein PGT21_014261 [Puccinia graminis f. sp. tritici]|uniref:Uncharacterized protein n=1 Tax=Puccinia graminis f. sp. tritici TaxID=56615 RepID=A0A5B0PR48_PUCGR|nr:hypothetical protein PGTUg99_036789 [Puccinia graminis f. sp. tritici]KAA1104187.1 hypothetical protein PGT21_014261 [Puccinia graminis f. sp. tritici]